MSITKLTTSVARQLYKQLSTSKSTMSTAMFMPGYSKIASSNNQSFVRSYFAVAANAGNGTIAGHGSSNCSCCSCRGFGSAAAGIHTQGDKELSQFLNEEIQAEKQMSKLPKHGPGVPGFDVSANGANITLTKKLNEETITVKFNVNGTVDTEGPSEEEFGTAATSGQPEQPPAGDMKARPDFVIEIRKPTGRALVFNCRLYGEEDDTLAEAEDDTKGDKFEIESFGILSKEDVDEAGDWDENVYIGDGGIIDGQLYDLLMNYLDERGIGVEFSQHLIDFSTHYEHTQYLRLLEGVKNFVEGK